MDGTAVTGLPANVPFQKAGESNFESWARWPILGRT